MAIPHNQAIMVLRQEGTTTTTVPQTSACSLIVVVNQLHPGVGRQDKQTLFASREAGPLAKPTIGSCGANLNKVSPVSLSAMAATNTSNQLCNLPAESTCKGITVTLDNNNMWNEFFRCQTEMILTKQGRRMFPCCRFRVSGLEPFQRYTLVMDMHPVDNYRYKWCDRRWETNGKADPHILRSFVHPDSPATGLVWMQYPISFYKLKLTNNPLDREGHIIINSMHRYIPRLHIIPGDTAVDAVQLDGPDVVTFSFSQTEFFAVTAYQNLSITQLKIDYNPFAKGFRDEASNSRCSKPKSAPATENLESEVKSTKETTALNNLKSLFAKMNTEKVTTTGDLKSVNCDGPRKVDVESCSSSMKRPWPGGLSELIKGAHVKIKRIPPEKNPNGNNEQMDVESLTSKENKDVASMDCISENISISDVTSEEKETSISNNTDSSTLKNTVVSASKQCISNKSLNENVATVSSETETLTEEASQSVVKPLDCGEVKKKRAEPVPLPLLALFLQQLKSKTRPSRPKAKSEACNLPSNTDTSIDDASVTENLPSSTASCNSLSLNTEFSIEPPASPTSQTIASSILTCTVESAEHEAVSTANSATDAFTACSTSIVPDTEQLSTPKEVSDTTSAIAHNVEPNTDTSSNITPDTEIVSIISSPSSDRVAGCQPKLFPAVACDAPNNEHLQSNDSTEKSTPEPAHDSSTVPCPDSVLEPVPRAPSPEVKTPSSPMCAPSSPCISAPSSPDPFPPSMFSDRPIPPRKSLDPFPPCLTLYKPRPLLLVGDLVPQRFLTRETSPIDMGPAVPCVATEVNIPVVSPNPSTPKKKFQKTSKGKKYKVKQKEFGKSKLSENAEVTERVIPIPMQPNLEDVEGQLFVSFMSKKALEIHLGDEAKEEILPKSTENTEGKVHEETESIDALEKVLLRDLKNMKYRQVIHPILQAVGLKLNLLDVTLSIDLQYLGVCLPIPPPSLLPEGNSETCSSQVHFVSRTGKTTDITKIKGWREKFSTSSSSVPGATTTPDTGQKNLSAFCSDMLDEYLESEGKLIDERAASFTQTVVSPVAYQLPTKSVSYVRTLDSVLKKQALPLATTLSRPSATSRKTALTLKNKKVVSTKNRKISTESSAEKTVSSTDKKLSVKPQRVKSPKRSMKSNASKSETGVPAAAAGLTQSKKTRKIKTIKGSKTLDSPKNPLKDSVSGAPEGHNASSTSGFNQRSSGLPKTLVKLRDVEDGAVWEGKRRTYISTERAAIALSCLVTAEGIMGGSPSTVIKRRAPPCLNDFCRLGCVCASLVQERRQHHCGKAECMLGCDCLRRRVVLLKNEDTEGSSPISHAEESGTKMKKRNRISYILSGSDATPEPVLHVKKLWFQQNECDLEKLYIPDSSVALQTVSQNQQKDMESFLHPSPKRKAVKSVEGEGMSIVKNQESLDCARVRPFCRIKVSPCRQSQMKEGQPDFNSQDSLQEIEEGELRPPTQSGPMKRLEIVSKCKWATEGRRNVVLRIVCEHMAQDRLNHPFWIGKYQIQPTTKTINETEEGSVITYKVIISQPHLEKSEEKNKEETIKQLEAQLIETIGKSEVKGLPLLSCVTPAGLLKAEKKTSGALGQIMVNGKLYPQAKLELGQMGALHPANRLAAYITGRVSVANKHEPNAGITATKTSHIAGITSTKPSITGSTDSAKISHTFSAIPTSVSTTAVTSTLSPSIALDNSTVVENPLVQFEISSINSQQTTSTSTLPVKFIRIISPSTSAGSTGISESPKIPPKATIASPTSGTIDGAIERVKAVPASGSAATEKTFVLSNTGSNIALPGSGITFMQPLTSARPAVSKQKMVMLKPTSGGVIHLVPLDQFRALNPNVVIRPQMTSLLRVPASTSITVNKPQTSPTVTSFTVPSSAIKDLKKTPLHSSTTDSVKESNTSTTSTKPGTLISGTKTLLICNKPSRVKIIPAVVKDPATNTLKILAQSVFEEQKTDEDARITYTAPSVQSSAAGHPSNQGLERTSQSFLTLKNQDPQKLDNPVHSSFTPTKESFKENSHSSENVIFTDHSYTFEMKKTSMQSKKSADVSIDSSGSANSSPYHMLLNEVLNLGGKEAEECGTIGAVQRTESDDESEIGSHLVEVEINSDCTDLTEDSDMYSDTDSIPSMDQEDRCLSNDSDEEQKKKQSVFGQTDKDDELVDIETFEEGAEEGPVLLRQTQHDRFLNISSDEEDENEDLIKVRKRKDEKQRRITLRKCFCNLQHTLNIDEYKVPKIIVLEKALKEVQTLSKQRDFLVNMQDKLREKRAHYIEKAAELSGENKASISQRLDEIISKQKSLVIEGKADDTRLNPTISVPEHSQRNVITKQKEMGTAGKAEHSSTSKRKHLIFQEQSAEKVRTNQKMTAAKPSQPNEPTNSHHTPQLRKCPPPFPLPCEKTRPNILTRKKPQLLQANDQVLVSQVIPIAEAAPYNEIITISSPLQPIDTTALGERQSTTPGVAMVSISVPPISHPFCENPLPLLQSQFLKLTSNPVNAPVDSIIFPKISSIVSLVSTEKLLTTPPDAALMQIPEACNSSAGEAQQISSSNETTLVEKEVHLDKQLPEVLHKQAEHDVKVRIEDDSKEQTTDEENMPKPDQDDEHLMSLLDELVFLNQTSESQGAASNLTEADVLTELLTNKEVDVDRDDERSLSPLFLKLDEDLITSPSSKDEEIDDIPPKLDDLVKVIFGSESPPNSSESEIVAAASDDCASVSVCHVKHDAPTPPPLLQMKTGGWSTADSPKEQANMSWRPMPKLAPLGLKTQETGHPKLISPHAPKSDSKLPSLHNTHV